MDEKTTKKVLFLITKSNWGGAQRYVYDLATSLPKDKFEPVVAVGGDGPLVRKLEMAGVRVVPILGLQRDISLSKEIRATRALYGIIKNEQPDVLHINSSKAGGLGALVGRVLGVKKIIFTAHGWAFNEDRTFISRIIIKLIHWLTVLLSHTTIMVSEALDLQMDWPLPANKTTVIYNGIPEIDFLSRENARAFFAERHSQLQPYQHDFWSISIGELHPVKQHDVSIKAMAEVVKTVPTTRHFIIGEGQERERLQALIVEQKLQEHVFLLGAIEEAARYLKAFDLFVLPSRSEALAYVAIEACFAGLPIIASKVGGVPEVLCDEAGVLVPTGDYMALCEEYVGLYHDRAKRTDFSERARQRSDSFTLTTMMEETTNVYT